MAALFRGIYEHQLDDKNRLRIPAKFKKGLTGEHGEKTYSFTRGINGCIYVFPDEVLDETLEELSEENSAKPQGVPLVFQFDFLGGRGRTRKGSASFQTPS